MPTEIWTATDLDDVRNDLAGSYIQMADIDLASYTADGGWNPIGDNFWSNFFTGTYDGGGYRIENLTIDRPIGQHQGLFGTIGGNAEIKNLKLTDVNIAADDFAGGITGNIHLLADGNADLNIYRCSVSGTVTMSDTSGGMVLGRSLVGSNGGTITIRECAAKGTVQGVGDEGSSIGGLIGLAGTCTFIDCYARVSVLSSRSAGIIGGFVGYSSSSTYTNCYAAGIVSTAPSGSGGFCGSSFFSSSVTNCYYDEDVSGQTDTGKGTGATTAEMTYVETVYSGWDFTDIWMSDVSGAANDYYPFLKWQLEIGKFAVTTVVSDVIRSTFPFVKIIVVWLNDVTGADHLHFRLKSAKEDINTQDDRERFGYSMDGGSTYIQFPEDGIPAVNPYGLIVAANIEVPPAEVAGLTPYCKIMEGSGAGQWWDLNFATRDDWWSLGLGEGVTASAWEPIFEHEVEGV